MIFEELLRRDLHSGARNLGNSWRINYVIQFLLEVLILGIQQLVADDSGEWQWHIIVHEVGSVLVVMGATC